LRDGKVHCLWSYCGAPCYHNFLVRLSVWDKGKQTHLAQNALHGHDFLILCCSSTYHVWRRPLHFECSKFVFTLI
jgi:hypothetical protein